MKKFVVASLETHLFFSRIMKEHALFLLVSFPSGETQCKKEANWYMNQFEKLLEDSVRLANGRVREKVLCSGEVVTEYTKIAEHQTQKLTGVPIRVQITKAEENLRAGCWDNPDRETVMRVRQLNQKALELLNGLIDFKERVLKAVLSCSMYTTNYPLLIEHILREAKWYCQAIKDIENGCMQNADNMKIEMFWNQIMKEHAEFIRGLLDPTECELINSANQFAGEYEGLLEMAKEQNCQIQEELFQRTLEITEEYRDFKAAGTQGITECDIRSIILPLLADHVLREANHYLRLLQTEDVTNN